jgi:DNA-binding Lrp family transcriptional regulator
VAQELATALVLINSDLGMEQQLLRELKKIENVKEAYFLYGLYDIIARVEGETMEDVRDTVNRKIRHMANITSTITLIVM